MRLAGRQVLVEVEAEEAGDKLAGSCPPDEEGQDAAEQQGRRQASKDRCDARCCALRLVLQVASTG